MRGSAVHTVGTATVGTDHIHCSALRAADIRILSAPGCNARAVAEYTLAALCMLAQRLHLELAGMRAGIIGCGRIGGRVAEWLGLLGVECICNDPPLAARHPDRRFAPLAEALAADIVSLHVPYTEVGPYATRQLVGRRQLQQLRPGAILINTARGGIIDDTALLERLQHTDLHTILDVWQGEPMINQELLSRTTLATPHIAGYSRRGRERATQMLYQQLCGEPPAAAPEHTRPLPKPSGQSPLADTIINACELQTITAAMRALARPGEVAARYTRLRKQYPLRREFPEYHLDWDTDALPLSQLGFADPADQV